MGQQSYVTRTLHRMQRRFRDLSWRMSTMLLERTTVTTAQGRFTVFTADQAIGRQLYVDREFESACVEATVQFLRASGRLPARGHGTVLDIGANVGVISIGMLRQQEFEKAIAIEPDPRNFSLLEHNARQNQLDAGRYICVPCAVSDQPGELDFELSGGNYGDHRIRRGAAVPSAADASAERFHESRRRTIRVKAAPLDHLLASLSADDTRDIALIWMDIQGHEGYAFLGGQGLFARDVPVACEIWPYGIHRAGLSQERFCRIASNLWTHFWVLRRGRIFVSYPTTMLSSLFDELGTDGDFENVVFTK